MNRMIAPHTAADPSRPLAVLVSGGLDSAILLAESLDRHPAVWPLYIQFGLFWEKVELHHLRRFLDTVRAPALRSLTGRVASITSMRGRIHELADATPLLVTVHPSYLLRLPDAIAARDERDVDARTAQKSTRLRKPPSTVRLTPLTCWARALARNTTASATSCARPRSPPG